MPRLDRSLTPLVLLLIASHVGLARDDDKRFVETHYAKRDVMIPMRDGVKLFASVYTPRERAGRLPILLERTPYGSGPYGADKYPEELGPSDVLDRAGYIVVHQDVRGCFLSEGKFLDVRPQRPDLAGAARVDESTDAYDTIDWLVKNVAGNNGKVGMWGISYPAFYAAAALIDAHPALKAVSPQAPLVDWFMGDDTHHNGAFFLHQEFNFDAEFGVARVGPTTKSPPPFNHTTRDAYKFFLDLGPLPRVDELYFHGKHAFWDDVMTHGSYDAFWKARNLLPHLKEIRPAVLTVGGWYDAEDLYGTLHTYARSEQSPGHENTLVMGPWVHGNWSYGEGDRLGPVRFGTNSATYYRETIEAPFFEYHLKGKGNWNPPEAFAFETGRNAWRKLDAWPPRQAVARSLYLQPGGKLGFDAPAGSPAFVAFESDPARPVPYTATLSANYPPSFMVEDQRFASRRPDVLTYQTSPLATDLTVAGPILADLVVSTSGTDSDWVVKLIDVYPDDTPTPRPRPPGVRLASYQQLVRGDVIRGKFRNSFEAPEPFVPDAPTNVPLTMQDVFHTFKAGHRVMVQVQSSWFPLVDRNPQSFVDIYRAKASDFRKATQRVYHAPGRASRLELRVMP